MEQGFQKFRISTLFDQIRPLLIFFWIPVATFLQIATWIYSQNLSQDEILILRIRIAFLILVICLFCKEWDARLKRRIGSCLPWLNRAYHVVVANEQMNVVGDDLFSMTTLVSLLTTSEFDTSNYIEYFLGAFFLVGIRPFRLFLRLSEPKINELFWEVSYQHSLLFIFGAGVAWKIQGDLRRKWLLIPNSTVAANPDSISKSKKLHVNNGRDYESSETAAEVQIKSYCALTPSH